MKPKTDVVMREIIRVIREGIPFDRSEEELCGDSCSHGCAKKVMEYLQMELCEWESRLARGEVPNFRDIRQLAKSGKAVYRVLEKNNWVKSDPRFK